MAHISLEDVRQMAGPLSLTISDISHPVRMEESAGNCNRCGACCKTQNGIILSLIDIYRISGKLGITPKDFFRNYCRISANIIDTFGNGPYKGILLTTKNGICRFYKQNVGCTINDVKPVTCQLYPFNDINITRVCLLKMQRIKDGEDYNGCYILDLPNNNIILPDFESLAANHIRRYITQEFLAQSDDRWNTGLAQKAKDDCIKLSEDNTLIEQYAMMLRKIFDDLDNRNARLLAEVLIDSTSP
jgi:Fe-S-cluster containining protein